MSEENEKEENEGYILLDADNNFHGMSGNPNGLKMFERIPGWRVVTTTEWEKIDSPNISKEEKK